MPTLSWGTSHTRNQKMFLKKISESDLGFMTFNIIKLDAISAFLSEYTPITQNRYCSLLVLLYKHAIDLGIVENNIAERKLKAPEGKRKRMNTFLLLIRRSIRYRKI